MLKKLQAFTKITDLNELESNVRLNWQKKRQHGKLVNKAAIETKEQNKKGRIEPWIENSAHLRSNQLDLMVENTRARVTNITTTTEIVEKEDLLMRSNSVQPGHNIPSYQQRTNPSSNRLGIGKQASAVSGRSNSI